MSTSQMEMNPNWTVPEQKRGGCGVFSCLLIGCGGMAVLCCGIGVWGIFYFRSMISDDPVQIAAERARIAQVDIPAGLQPMMAMNLKLPFAGEIAFGVIYVDRQTGSSLILMTVNRSFAEGEGTNLREVLQQALQQEAAEQAEDFRFDQRLEKQVTVRGKEETFLFTKGKSAKTGTELLEVQGAFEGDAGPTVFHFLGDAGEYNEERITEVLQSIK